MTSESTPPSAAFAAARWLLRILLSVTGLLMLAQPVSIGQYLQGRFTMLQVHSGVANGLIIVSFFTGLAAIFYAIAGGRVWVAIAIPLFGFIIEVQYGMGYARQLDIHVPLGVAVVVVTVLLCVWSWTPSSRRCRPRRRRVRQQVRR